MKLILLFLIISTCNLSSQVSYLFDIQTDEYPLVKAKFLGLNPDGTAIEINSPKDLLLRENGDTIEILTLSCPTGYDPGPINAVLTIDRSISVGKDGILDLEKVGATDWVVQMKDNSETAIIGFNDKGKVYSSFTNDKQKLIRAIKWLKARGSTDFNGALLGPVTGAIELAEEFKDRNPVIILMTDGEAEVKEGKVIIDLLDLGAKFFPIIIGQQVPANLKAILDFPGIEGRYFDNIKTEEEIKNAFKIINLITGNAPACDISWISSSCEESRNLDISLSSSTLSSQTDYQVDYELMPQIEYLLSDFLIFEDTEISETDEKFILLKAFGEDITIDTIISDNKLFTILKDNFPNKNFPIIIPNGEQLKIYIEFNYEKKGFHFASFDIISNACLGNNFYAQGGEPGEAPGSGDFKILFPNGGEQFISKSDTDVSWKGSPPDEDILLEYTTDNGITWITLETKANNFTNKFPIPDANSSECRVRATKFSKDFGKEILSSTSQEIPVNNLEWQPSELTIAFANSDGKIRLLNSFHGGPFLTSKSSHQGEARAVSWSPDATRFASVGDDGRLMIWSFSSEGTLIKNISLADTSLLDVSWSSDGRDIAVASSNGEIIIVRTTTMKESNRFSAHSRATTKLAWSPDGKLLASGSRDSSIAVWRRDNWTVSAPKFKAHNGWISGLEWRDDFIISSSEVPSNNKIKIWLPTLGQLFGEIDLKKDGSVKSLDYNDKLDLLSYSLGSGDVYIYDMKGEEHKEYDFKTTAYAHLDWNPSGTKLASGENTNTINNAHIYSVDRFAQDYDESDSNFSINTISFNTKDIDFGLVPILKSKDSVVTNYIIQLDTFSFLIDSIRISRDNENVFTASSYDNTIFPTDFSDIKFSFTPKEEKDYSAIVTVYSAFGNKTKKITGVGGNLLLADTTINFGTWHTDNPNDSTRQIFLANNTGEDLVISNISPLEGAFPDFFKIESGINPSEIKNGKNKSFIISYNPKEAGDHSAEIILEYELSSFMTIITLLGEGVKPDFSINQENFPKISCTERDTIIIEVKNTGAGELFIDSPALNSNIFSKINFNSFILDENNSASITIDFNPINSGTFNSDLIIYSNKFPNNSDTFPITGEMLETSFITSNNNNIYALKSNLSNTQIDTNIIIINTGNTNISWTDIQNKSINNIFSNPSLFPLNIAPTESSTLTLTYPGGNYGTNISDDYILTDQCSNKLNIKLNVEISNISAILSADKSLTFSDLICETSTFTSFKISNSGISDLIINDIYFANNIEFNITNKSDLIDKIIIANESKDLEIEFSEINNGNYIDTLIIKSNDNNSPFKSIIYGNKKSIKLDYILNNNELVFDISENKSVYSSTFIINNSGTSDNYWNNLPINISNFSITNISPNPIPVNGKSIVIAEYKGTQPDTVLFNLKDICGTSSEIKFIAYSKDFPEINFILPKKDVRLNKQINIPIKYELNEFFDENKLLNAKFKLKFNPTLLKNLNPKYNIEFTQDTGFIEINVNQDFINLKELNTGFFILWGNDSISYLILDELILEDNNYRFNSNINVGKIRITDLCPGGESSLFLSGGLLNLTISPNPSDNLITISLSSNIKINKSIKLNVNLYSLEGAFKSNLYSGEIQDKLTINASNIESGIYLLQLNINGISVNKKISIIH
jgi:WD40 repeat protein